MNWFTTPPIPNRMARIASCGWNWWTARASRCVFRTKSRSRSNTTSLRGTDIARARKWNSGPRSTHARNACALPRPIAAGHGSEIPGGCLGLLELGHDVPNVIGDDEQGCHARKTHANPQQWLDFIDFCYDGFLRDFFVIEGIVKENLVLFIASQR